MAVFALFLFLVLSASLSGAVVHDGVVNDETCGSECEDSEVKCGGQCVAKAFNTPFNEAVSKFEAYIQEISGKADITVQDIGMADVSEESLRHELWVLKFLWLKARWGGVCEKAAFSMASNVGIYHRSEADSAPLLEILKATASVAPALAKIAAAKVPLEPLDEAAAIDRLEKALATGQVSGRRGKKKEKPRDTAELGDELLEHMREEEERAFSQIEAIMDEHAKQLERNRRSTIFAQQALSAEQELDEKASAWNGPGENPYTPLQSAVTITNEYMEMSYTTAGYGQHGQTQHHEKAGPKRKKFEDVGIVELSLVSTYAEWLAFHTKRSCPRSFSEDAERAKGDIIDLENQRLKFAVAAVEQIAPPDARGIAASRTEQGCPQGCNIKAMRLFRSILAEKDLPSVRDIKQTGIPWWKQNGEANKKKYFQLIREVELEKPNSVPKCP